MFGSSVLDIAIGLAFLYLLLGLVCTTINELIESGLRKRATDLEKGILEMLGHAKAVEVARQKAEDQVREEQKDNPNKEAVEKAVKEAGDKAEAEARKTTDGWVEKLYQHPLIFSLFDGDYEKSGRNLPSYIPARNFALALLDLVKPAAPAPAGAVTLAALSGAAGTDALPAAMAAPVVGNTPSDELIKKLREDVGTNDLPENVKAALLVLIDSAANDINRVRENIEKWFDKRCSAETISAL